MKVKRTVSKLKKKSPKRVLSKKKTSTKKPKKVRSSKRVARKILSPKRRKSLQKNGSLIKASKNFLQQTKNKFDSIVGAKYQSTTVIEIVIFKDENDKDTPTITKSVMDQCMAYFKSHLHMMEFELEQLKLTQLKVDYTKHQIRAEYEWQAHQWEDDWTKDAMTRPDEDGNYPIKYKNSLNQKFQYGGIGSKLVKYTKLII